MNFRTFIESAGSKLLICDIQPAFAKYIHFDMRDFCNFAMNYENVVVLYNGPDFGFESSGAIANWYRRFGISTAVLRRWRWFEKNYAWFRDMMDVGCYQRSSLVKLARYMMRNRIWDWRELSEDDFKRLGIMGLSTELVDRFSFAIPDLAFKLRSMNGADICGGGVNECLAEVMILAEALNIKLNVINDWVY